MGRMMGVDIGSKRWGIALSDPQGRIATPHTVLDATGLKADGSPLKRLVEEWEITTAVVGLPYSLDGAEGPQAAEVRDSAFTILAPLGLDVVFTDERLSSAEATRTLREAGRTERQARGKKDMIAASLILQAYLDRMKVESE